MTSCATAFYCLINLTAANTLLLYVARAVYKPVRQR